MAKENTRLAALANRYTGDLTMFSRLFCLTLLCITLLYLAEASHFRGAIIQWSPVDPENFDGQIVVTHRIGWRRSCCGYDATCGTSTLFGDGGYNLECRVGCIGHAADLRFICTDFSLSEDWVSGGRSSIFNIGTDVDYFEASFTGGGWIGLVVGGGSWEIRVKGNLTQRPDGRVNSSPVSTSLPLYRIQHGCQHVIRLPVEDAERDTIRCRWAKAELNECAGVCNAFPNAALDMDRCTLSYDAIYGVGHYGVALQIEDFLVPSSQTPLSSVPLQFLVLVFESQELCGSRPELVPGETPPDGSCIPVELGTTYRAGIVATSGGQRIIEFPTASPFGLTQTAVTQSMFDPDLYYINVTWTATLDNFGSINIFCFSATNTASITSPQSCITLLSGVLGPRIVPESIQPTGTISPSPSTIWSMTFDQPVQRPVLNKLIRVHLKRTDELVHSIDATSSDVMFPVPCMDCEEGTVTFSINFNFDVGESYYILIDGGAAVGNQFCNQESHHIIDTAFWTFTVGSIELHPRFGNMLGGTPVLIDPGVPFAGNEEIDCDFDGIKTTGVHINSNLALCVSPTLPDFSSIPFELTISGRAPQQTEFLSVSPERAHSVSISDHEDGLLLAGSQDRTITWSSDLILPDDRAGEAVLVDISLYAQVHTRSGGNPMFTWKQLAVLAEGTSNDGEETVTIPSIGVSCSLFLPTLKAFNICPVAIKVSVSESTGLPTSIGVWTGIVFIRSSFRKGASLREQCTTWSNDAVTTSPTLRALQPCPPNQLVANFDIELEREDRSSMTHDSSNYEEKYMEYFHPTIDVCYRQNVPTGGVLGQQCCYTEEGQLVIGASSGGSSDNFSPKVAFNQHLLFDLVPYVLCCKNDPGLSLCDSYYSARPSGNEIGYSLPIPACVYGDPHVVTVDGHKYTFNGKGEFTLIETEDNVFALQGRMEQVLDLEGNSAPGTVFTAIVAQLTNAGTSVQFQVEGDGLQVLLNGEIVAFNDVPEQKFENVGLLNKGNATVVAVFSIGASIEIKVENRIISVMLVGLPESMRSKTRGLMGTFNGITTDDLIPKGRASSIPLESSLEDIHSLFGITWIIDDEADSLFTYAPGTRWSDFYHPNFSPMFQPVFDDPLLEEEARSTCGDDEFCLFDIAATKRVDIGAATMQGGEDFDRIVEMSVPIVCDPPCANGVCLENNTCSCSEGFDGNRCTQPIMEECEANFCENRGVCTKQALTYSCQCTSEFEGSLCQDKVPPFHIQLINSSPRVTSDRVSVNFITSKPATSTCFFKGSGINRIADCSNGEFEYEGPEGSYIFKIVARSTQNRERDIIRRRINIGSCAVHMINAGVTKEQNATTIEFVGTESVSGYFCRLDDRVSTFCQSPLHYSDLSTGAHRLIVTPLGCTGEKLSVKFEN